MAARPRTPISGSVVASFNGIESAGKVFPERGLGCGNAKEDDKITPNVLSILHTTL